MHGTQSWHHLSNWNFTQNAVSHNDVPDLVWYDAGYNFRNVGLCAKTWHCKTYLETKPLHLQTVMRQGCIEISVHIPDFAGPICATLDGTGSTKTGTIEATRFWAIGTWRPISVSHAPMATCHNTAVAGPRWRRASDNVRIVIDSEQPLTAIKACSQRTSWTNPSLKCFIFPFYFRAGETACGYAAGCPVCIVTLAAYLMFFRQMPSVLWHCWLGGRKGIQPVKSWVAGCWRGYLRAARCRLAYVPADATATHCLLLQ